MNALLHATYGANIDRVREVISANPKWINAVDPELGVAPLHVAAEAGLSAVLDLLLEQKAEPEIRDRAGNTPLHLAALNGQVDATAILCQRGADVNARDYKGVSPLALATFSKVPEAARCASILRASGANADVLTAIYSNDTREILRLAVDQTSDSLAQRLKWYCIADLVNAWLIRASVHATGAMDVKRQLEHICKEQANVLDSLIANGADINALGVIANQPALTIALSDSAAGTALVRLLLSRGASPSVRDSIGRTPLDYAVGLGNHEAAAMLRSAPESDRH